ncbi:MAG: DUF2500 domain-containing protein [Verrucomicrobia bacterium]|nr:DUF2500 domain-containing protein [Verrucomicrobiota bacterium]
MASGFDAMFTLVPLFIGVVFVFVIGSIVFRAIQGISRWSANNSQPVLTADGKVVSKRADVHGSRERHTTNYYATFELGSGARREFALSGSEYGLLAEGDTGLVSFQGSRYLGFSRAPAVEGPPMPPPSPASANLICEYCRSAIPAGAVKCASCGWTYQPKRAEAEQT